MYADSALSLVVPIFVIALVFITKRVVLSLLLGIVLASFMMKGSDIFGAVEYVITKIGAVFYEYGALNMQSVYVFGFLLLLGILTQLMSHSGGIGAFVKWARKHVKSARGSEFVAFIAGIVIFIDDYFNALSVGQISKSLNDANHSTRERLAYVIDSTSAPVCILMPISSWGAYILVQLDKNFSGDNFLLLFESIWANFYAWFALLGVFLTILWQINLPAMRKYRNVGVVESFELDSSKNTSVWLLVIPVLALICFVAGLIFYTGYRNSGEFSLISMLGKTDTGFSLFWGGFGAFILTILLSFKNLKLADFAPILKQGSAAMLPACLILVLAWAIGPIIKDDLSTGQYLANLSREFLESSTMNASFVIVLVSFLISGFIAFCTGTSWATFAIMIPIGASLAQVNGIEIVLVISAILSGAVFGDHASPISDTTILSATGAGCSAQSHFLTQLPYVCTAAFIALVCFSIAGLSGSILLAHCVGLALGVGIFYLYKRAYC